MPATWGTNQWGTTRWADTSFGHRLKASGVIVITATGVQLRHSHLLDLRMTMRITAQNVGLGPIPIHPLAAHGAITIVVAETTLRLAHPLTATGDVVITADEAFLVMGHPLAAAGDVILLGNDAFLSIRHPLSATGTLAILAEATDLDLSHPLSAHGAIIIGAEGAYERFIPTPTPVEFTGVDPHGVIHGAVNLIDNPTLDVTALDWSAHGDATLARVTDHGWHGPSAAEVVISSGGTDNGMALTTRGSLGITPYPGSVLWGQVRLAADAETLTYWTRAIYSDGAVQDAPEETVIVTASGLDDDSWLWALPPPLVLNPAKVLARAEIVVNIADAATGTFWADGAMIEYDPFMYGPSLWIIGSTEAAVFAEYA